MRAAFFAFALLPYAALAKITITTPSASSYWVQNISNTITWNYESGDPSPVNILVTNQDNTTLNGDFSIAQFVIVSAQSFTVTNVTLVVGSNYQVVFVNPTNPSQVYANSSNFEVRAAGTSPAPTSTSSSSGSSSGNSVGSSGTSSSTSPSSTSSSTSKKNSASGIVDVPGLLYASIAIGLGAFFSELFL